MEPHFVTEATDKFHSASLADSLPLSQLVTDANQFLETSRILNLAQTMD
jgi:hypothetical protein